MPDHPIGPLSSRHRLRHLDGRTKEAKFLRATEAALVEHLGGPSKITAPQRFLVQRVATDLLRLELYDDKLARGEELTDHDGRILHALQNAVSRNLRALGLKGSQQNQPRLADYIAQRVAESAS